jgi:peptide/nickel transport system permease protein
MLRLIGYRLLISVPLLFGVSVLTFVLVSLTPGDAARTILGANGTPQQYAQLRHQLGLDQPLYGQYGHWLDRVVHGNLGNSLFTGEPVTQALNERLSVTLSLIIAATVLSAILGVALGVLSALRTGTLGRAVDVMSLAGLALPNFWLGLLLVTLLAVEIHLFPATGYVPLSQSIGDWARALVLPVVTLVVGGVAVVAKHTRDSMLDVLRRDFIRTLRANGVSEWSIVFRHALKNAAIPVVTVLGLIFVSLLSGTVLVESVFVLPGLGSLAVQATNQHDIPVIQGVAIYFTLIVITVNLLVDLTYGWLNPKVRSS